MTLGDFDHKARILRHFWIVYNKKGYNNLKSLMIEQGQRLYSEMKLAVKNKSITKSQANNIVKEYKLEKFLELLKNV